MPAEVWRRLSHDHLEFAGLGRVLEESLNCPRPPYGQDNLIGVDVSNSLLANVVTAVVNALPLTLTGPRLAGTRLLTLIFLR